MKSAKDYLQSEVNRLVSKARAITAAAEEENRSLSDDERMQVEGFISETNTLKARMAEQEDNDRLLGAIEAAGKVTQGAPSDATQSAKNAGEAFVQSDGYKGLQARGLKGAWTTGPVELRIGRKLTDTDGNTVVSEGGTGDGLFAPLTHFQPTVLPGIQRPIEQKLTVADLLGTGTTTTNTIVYLKETGADNGADLTSEGAAKPPSEIDFEKVSTSVDKIATFLPVSDEMMEDEAQVVSYINGRLVVFVKQREEEYLVDLINDVAGTASSAAEVGGDNLFDAIAAGIYHVRLDAQEEPDAVIVSPLDAAKMDVTRAVAGDGNYFSGGPYAAAAQNPWGLRRVVSTVVSDGAPLVGAFRQGATLWRRGGVSVEASNSHADYFIRNMTALRAEERLALTIFRDDAFQVCGIS